MTSAVISPTSSPRLPPAATLFTVALIILLVSGAALYRVTQQRWIGARFAPPANSSKGVVVKKVYPDSPADGVLNAGQKLVAISNGESAVALDPVILEAPNNLQTYAIFNRFVATQNDIWRILQAKEVRFQTDRGEWLSIHPGPEWPARAIRWPYWLYAPASSIGIFFALLVWIKNPAAPSSIFLQLLVWDIFLTLSETILIDRELAHPYLYMRIAAAAENFGTNLFFPIFIGLFLLYPKQLVTPRVAFAIPILALLIPLNNSFQWLEHPFHAYMLPGIIGAFILLYTVFLQWRISSESPLNRHLIKTTFLWMFIPFSIPFSLFALPVVFGATPVFTVAEARIMVTGVGTGLAIGILHHGLFDVDRWLINSLLWLASSILVILIDIAVVSLLNLQPASALTLALLIAGLIYFPLRQQLLLRLLPDSGKSVQALLPEFSRTMRGASTAEEFEQRWLKILENRFTPARIRTIANIRKDDGGLADGGLALLAPTLSRTGLLRLSGKNNGSRLFNNQDVEFVKSLLPLTRMLQSASEAKRRAQIQERSHIMRDLKNTLGTKLESLVLNAPGDEERSCARNALATLDDTIHFSGQKDPITLGKLTSAWKREFELRLRGTDVHPLWKVDGDIEAVSLPPIKALILTNVFRESITNALKHARPENIAVALHGHGKRLILIVRNDGETTDPERWNPCSGLNGMRSRIQSSGGELQLQRVRRKNQSWTQVKAVLPLKP